MTTELIGTLTGRFDAYAHGDLGPVLDALAVAEARALFNCIPPPDGRMALQVVRLLARLHWCRAASGLADQLKTAASRFNRPLQILGCLDERRR